jgi:dTDP-4-dehydrorhamnose reductase
MAVTITVKQTQSIEEGNLFRVLDEVTSSTDIAAEVFVFTTETQAFSRVATVYDIEHILDTTYEDAVTNAAEYYRLDTVQKDYTTQAKAETFAAYTLARIRTLVGDYIEYSEGFEGVTTYIYTGA